MLRNQLVGLALCSLSALAAAQTSMSGSGEANAGGPVRLRQPIAAPQQNNPNSLVALPPSNQLQTTQQNNSNAAATLLPPYQPGEFERFVQRIAAPDVRRFGAELITDAQKGSNSDASSLVPPDYLLGAGDELVVTLWGSIDADLRLVIDRTGRISIPRVGPVMLSGVRYADAPEVIRHRVAQVFRNFDLSVSLGQLRAVQVYITGFVARPGAYSVSSLSTISSALIQAGGPSAAGSFRAIQLRRSSEAPIALDLYDFLLKGDLSGDRILQAGDVVYVGPVGTQVALIGSVNKPAIFELKEKETIADVLRMAGGFTPVADRTRLAVERLEERNSIRIAELSLPSANDGHLRSGDVLRAFSAVDATLPMQRQNKRVRVEGEVLHPGVYILPAGSMMSDALRAAGGITPIAYVFGTEFTRETTRTTQQDNYDRALRELETAFTKATVTQRAISADEAAAQSARANNTAKLIERLRAVQPTGRIVLQMPPVGGQLPNLGLEDGDRLYIPPYPTTVGVFGSVVNTGSYLYTDHKMLDDYIKLAGGPTRGADEGNIFVIRANGSVASAHQRSGWFGTQGVRDIEALPGDTVFVPEEMDKTTFIQHAKDWAQILSQFGLGAAAIKVLGN